MPSRRQFLMAAITALAATGTSAALLLLRSKPIREPVALEPTSPPQPTGTPFLPPVVPSDTPPIPTATMVPPVLLAEPTCTAAAQAPIPRAEWGARPPAVSPEGTGENGPYSAANPNGWLVYDQPLDQVYQVIIVHHSALPLSDGPREIQNLHMDEKGFADIGYHYLIDQNGSLYEGRAIDVRGAHTLGYNYGSIGICLIGNFEEIQPAQPQIEMLQSLIACLLGRYPNINRLAGHRDYNPGVTLCPGANLAPLLPLIAEQFGLASGA
jgi:hypothetical protein